MGEIMTEQKDENDFFKMFVVWTMLLFLLGCLFGYLIRMAIAG